MHSSKDFAMLLLVLKCHETVLFSMIFFRIMCFVVYAFVYAHQIFATSNITIRSYNKFLIKRFLVALYVNLGIITYFLERKRSFQSSNKF